ncbi:hypothetical protein [Kitasatospora kifunensis]|uniref:IrrE N-terminal-like domain-containing protein n=1 Tax=Kitasatospora kifunensis TaxID=58351 RepID=A0A7W7VWA1_KITKI|nr:hypothetical protein [Kitasatospora kifunensis]MBB4924330.1 hypothetical protein [Kitasatospora kifunensis]
MRWRRQPRSELSQLADRLVVPNPFDLTEFCAAIARERGRPLHLVPVENAADADLPCGLWVSLGTADLVFYEAGAAPILKTQIVLHEISHMLLNHVSPEASSLADLVVPAESAELALSADGVSAIATAAAAAIEAEAAARAADLELGLATDRLLSLLARDGYGSRQEADAESLATLILERATRVGAEAASPSSTGVLSRLNDALGHPARRT